MARSDHRAIKKVTLENHKDLNALTAQCVKCGLCLPHCPTYALYNKESESPRGRMAIAEGMLTGAISAATGQIEHCLQCGACERACPSQVQVTKVIAQLQQHKAGQSAIWAAQHPRWLSTVARLGQHIPAIGQATKLNQALSPLVPAPKPGTYNRNGKSGRVALFLGCLTHSHQGQALHDALFVLTRLDYCVEIPAGQTCCGALAKHNGDDRQTAAQAARNAQAFVDASCVLAIASACSAQLSNAQLAGTTDLYKFLAQADWQAMPLAPLPAQAAIWMPCTHTGAGGDPKHLHALLNRIEGLNLQLLDRHFGCCGAGGMQLLSNPQQAAQLRAPILQHLRNLQPDYLISSNIGCTLHLAEGLRTTQHSMTVMHPVSLLAQQIRSADNASNPHGLK